MTSVVESGYDCLVNVGYVANSWYLDNLDQTWANAYGVDMRASVPPHLQAKVLGGHGEMWGSRSAYFVRGAFNGAWSRRETCLTLSMQARRWTPRTSTVRSGRASPRSVSDYGAV